MSWTLLILKLIFAYIQIIETVGIKLIMRVYWAFILRYKFSITKTNNL